MAGAEIFLEEDHLETGNIINLDQDQLKIIEDKIQQFENSTGCELLVVVTDACDPYPAASFRFGFIASILSGFLLSYFYEFANQSLWTLIFLCNFVVFTWAGSFSWTKKLALSSLEIQRECREKAIELFHSLGTREVSHSVTVMIMISLLEKRIEVLVDKKIKEKITPQDLNKITEIMSHHFKKGDYFNGLRSSIDSLREDVLRHFSGKVQENPPESLSNNVRFVTL